MEIIKIRRSHPNETHFHTKGFYSGPHFEKRGFDIPVHNIYLVHFEFFLRVLS